MSQSAPQQHRRRGEIRSASCEEAFTEFAPLSRQFPGARLFASRRARLFSLLSPLALGTHSLHNALATADDMRPRHRLEPASLVLRAPSYYPSAGGRVACETRAARDAHGSHADWCEWLTRCHREMRDALGERSWAQLPRQRPPLQELSPAVWCVRWASGGLVEGGERRCGPAALYTW